jgi:hypothetical protein
MVVNLLHYVRDLNEQDCKEIVDAMNKFGPSKYRTSPLSYYATAIGLALLSREEIIAALHVAHGVYGTAAALNTAQKLKELRGSKAHSSYGGEKP